MKVKLLKDIPGLKAGKVFEVNSDRCIIGTDDLGNKITLWADDTDYWEEINENEIQAGDYVKLVSLSGGNGGSLGSIFRITSVNEIKRSDFGETVEIDQDSDRSHSWQYLKDVQKSSEAEYLKYKESRVSIAGYEMEKTDTGIQFGCQKFSKAELQSLYDAVSLLQRVRDQASGTFSISANGILYDNTVVLSSKVLKEISQ